MLDKVDIISTVIRRSVEGRPVPTSNTIIMQGGSVDIDLIIDKITADLRDKYLSKTTEDEAIGLINFKPGIKVGGVEFKYDSTNNAVYVQHSDGSPVNFYATGGLSMYGQGKTSVKTIMDAIAANLDSNTLAIENGLLTVIGGTGSGGIESITKQMVIDALGFTPYNASNPNGYITAASIPSSIKNPYALTFGSKTYDGSSAKEITASDLGAALSSDLAKYLPLSGGTISGQSANPLTINSTNSENKCYIPFTVNGVIKAYVGASNGDAFLQESTKNNYISINSDGAFYNTNKLWHEGNFNPANYLPLSGGTIKGKLIITHSDYDDILTIKRIHASGNSIIKYSNSTEFLGHIGVYGSAGSFPYHPMFADKDGNQYKIWHSGNDGSGSGLDADLLDGLQPSELDVLSSKVLKNNADTIVGYDLRYRSSTIVQGEDVDGAWVSPTGNHTSGDNKVEYAGILRLGRTSKYYNDLFFNMNTGAPQWRQVVNGAHKGWRTFAFTDSNVASATKLKTARTIWGQSFDGSGDVTGCLHINFKSYNGDYTQGLRINAWDGVSTIFLNTINASGYDNGMWAITANVNGNLRFRGGATSLSDFLVVTQGGNVGFGTTNPLSKCHIAHDNWDNGLILQRTVSGGGAGIKFMSTSSMLGIIGINGNKTLEVNLSKDGSTNVNRLTIDNTGTMVVNSDNSGVIVVKRIKDNGGAYVDYHNNNSSSRHWRVGSNSHGNFSFYSYASSTETERITIVKSGYMGLGESNPSARLHVVGNILATGGVTMQSQRSLKNVVDERGLSLTELSAIKPTRYTWKDKRDDRIHFGGIADDIEKVLPEVIYKTADGTLTMDYGNAGFAIASSLIKPVVDHETKIRMLEIRVKELEEELKRYSA